MRLRPSRVKNLIAKVTSTDPGGLAPPRGQVRVDKEKNSKSFMSGHMKYDSSHQPWVRAIRELKKELHCLTSNTVYSHPLYLYIYHTKFV